MQDITMLRNIVLLGHGNCGKTSLADAMIFSSGGGTRHGKVDDGTSVMDFEPEEVSRKISISTSCYDLSWKKHQVFFMDTPGDDNFLAESRNTARVADSAVLVLGAVLGVRNQTKRFSGIIAGNSLPAAVFINKMDRERADFARTVQQIKDQLGMNPAVLYLPIGAEDSFSGLVDVVAARAFVFADDGSGKMTPVDIPDDLVAEATRLREELMEKVAETDEALLDAFLEEGALTDDQLRQGLRRAVNNGEIHPLCAGAALQNKGTHALLDMLVHYLPSPVDRPTRTGVNPKTDDVVERDNGVAAPFSAQVFKTMADPYAGRLSVFRVFSGSFSGDSFYNANKDVSERFGQLFLLRGKEQKPVDEVGPGMIAAVAKLKETATGDTICEKSNPIVYDSLPVAQPVISFAVSTEKGDEDKLFSSISRMLDEDPALRLEREPQTNEILLSGVGQIHLEVICEKIKRKFGVAMHLSLPQVPYRETIRKSVRVQGRHKKQSGGRGQFGDVWIEMAPRPRGAGYQFEDRVVGGVVPKTYIPAVDKGIQEAMEKGVLAGYPMVDVMAALVDGSYHAVDSSEIAFKIAGSLAFKKAAQEANPVLLEPIMDMEIRVLKDHVGDVMGDLNSRRGRVMGMDSDATSEIITAQAPLSEIQTYANELNSMSGGQGGFVVRFSHYEEVPAQLAEKIIAARQEKKE